MTRIFASFMLVVSLCAAATAGVNPGSITGYVKNTGGAPQMGATVQLVSAAGQLLVVHTDTKGYFVATGLIPGSYDVHVTAPSFLPTLREDVMLAAGATKVLNITLNTLFEAVGMLPPLKKTDDENDSWKWTLRNTANRPVLRFDGDTALIVETQQEGQPRKGSLALMAGAASEGYGSASDLGTAFNIEQSLFHTGTLGFSGDLGYGDGMPDGVLRTSYVHNGADGWNQSVALMVRRFAAPENVPHGGALQAISMSYADGFSVGIMDFQVGGEAEAIQFLGQEDNAFRPSATMDFHLGSNTILEYRYATTEPTTRAAKGFDTAPADLTESAPRMTMVDGNPILENAHHHELSLSQRIGDKSKFQLAYYNDRVKDPALLGVGDINTYTGDILPDVYSGTFNYNGGDLRAQGVRFVFQRRLSNALTATVDYGYGGVLELDQPNMDWNSVRSSINSGWRHTAALKLNGYVPRTHAKWIASYRWTSGQQTLVPVDMFNASAGQTDPYFNIFFRQPLPHFHGMPGNMEAIIDVRNLLAQGYVPVMGPDGQTVYLVQSARSVRGGLAFTF